MAKLGDINSQTDVGSTPPVPDNTLIQWGNTVMTTDSGGNCGVNFATAFSAPATCVASEAGALNGHVAVQNVSSTLSGFNVRGPDGPPVGNALVRVHWYAIGPR
jgi:hypothetical protein